MGVSVYAVRNTIGRKACLPSALLIVLSSTVLLPASAQQAVNPAVANSDHVKTVPSSNVRASSLVGLMVMNSQNAQLGRVHDLIFDWTGEQLQYLVLAARNQLAGTEEFIVYPSNRFQVGRWEDQLLLDGSRGGMTIQPEDTTASTLLHRLAESTSTTDRGPQQAADRRLSLLSGAVLLGAPVIDAEGMKVGELNDLVVSLPDGRIRYVAMDPVATFNMENRLLILPVRAMQPQLMRAHGEEQASHASTTRPVQKITERVELRLAPDLDKKHLALGRTVNKKQWPKVNGPHIKEELNSYVLNSSWPWHGSNSAGNNGSGGTRLDNVQSEGQGSGSDMMRQPSGPIEKQAK